MARLYRFLRFQFEVLPLMRITAAFFALSSLWLAAQPPIPKIGQGIITTVAGVDSVFTGDGQPATAVSFAGPLSIASARDGCFYVGDHGNAMVFRIDPLGKLTIIAGTGIHADAGDGGPPAMASLDGVLAIAVDDDGNLTIATRRKIRRVPRHGNIFELASHDFASPLLAARKGGEVFLAGRGGTTRLIRLISSQSVVNHAGFDSSAPAVSFAPDGALATSSLIGEIDALAIDSDGQSLLFIEENVTIGALFAGKSFWLRRIDSAGRLKTIVSLGSGRISGLTVDDQSSNGPTTYTTMNGVVTSIPRPKEEKDGRVRVTYAPLTPSSKATAVVFDAKRCPDAPHLLRVDPSLPSVACVTAAVVDATLCPEPPNLRRVDPSSPSVTCAKELAGGAPPRVSAAALSARAATFSRPTALAVDRDKMLYVGDERTNRVHLITPEGLIYPYAGGGSLGDGALATLASLQSASPLSARPLPDRFLDHPRPDLFLAGPTLRSISSDHHLYTLATLAYPPFSGVTALHATSGLLYFAANSSDGRGNSTSLWSMPYGGVPNRLAGVAQNSGSPRIYSGPSTALEQLLPFNQIKALHVNSVGNILFSDSAHTHLYDAASKTLCTLLRDVPANGLLWNGLDTYLVSVGREVRQYTRSCLPSTPGYSPPCPVLSCSPTLLVGGGPGPDRGDGGPASKAGLREAGALASDNEGNLYIADPTDARIRKVLAAAPAFDALTLDNQPVTTLDFEAFEGGLPTTPRALLVRSSGTARLPVPGLAFSVKSSATWLRVDDSPSGKSQTPLLLNVSADPQGLLPAGQPYVATLTFSMPGANPPEQVIPVRLNVRPALPPKISLSEDTIDFFIPKDGAPRTRFISVSNSGGGLLPFEITVESDDGASWLKIVNPTAAEVGTRSPVSVEISADAAGLLPGYYNSRLRFSSAGKPITDVSVSLSVSEAPNAIQLSQKSISFTAVVGAGVVPSQAFAVLNLGDGELAGLTITAKTGARIALEEPDGSGNTTNNGDTPDWLSARACMPTNDDCTQGDVSVSVDPSGLKEPGQYSGVVSAKASNAPNSPHFVTVYLRLLPANASPAPLASPVRLSFPGGTVAPSAQSFHVYGLKDQPVGVHISSSLQNVRVLPSDALIERGQPLRVVVQPIDAAPVQGSVFVQFDDGRLLQVPFATGGPPSAGPVKDRRHSAEPCLLRPPTFETLSPGFRNYARSSITLRVKVTDSCGNLARQEDASVNVSFTNGDPEIPLKYARPGIWDWTWETTWNPQDTSRFPVVVTATVSSPGQADVKTPIDGALDESSDTNPELSVESYKSKVFAPGSLITLNGYRLAQKSAAIDPGKPYKKNIEGTTVLFHGNKAFLASVSPNSVQLVVPFAVPDNVGTVELVLNRGSASSVPVGVKIVPAQPEIDSVERRGAELVISCTGLGRVNGEVKDGVPASEGLSPLAEISVTVGGVPATEVRKVMVAGEVGRYEVLATLPPEVAEGDPVVLTAIVPNAADRSSECRLPAAGSSITCSIPEPGDTTPSGLRPKR